MDMQQNTNGNTKVITAAQTQSPLLQHKNILCNVWNSKLKTIKYHQNWLVSFVMYVWPLDCFFFYSKRMCVFHKNIQKNVETIFLCNFIKQLEIYCFYSRSGFFFVPSFVFYQFMELMPVAICYNRKYFMVTKVFSFSLQNRMK